MSVWAIVAFIAIAAAIGSSNVDFKPSSNADDALTYTLTISARFVGQTSWVRSASATFKYINPCPTSAITGVSFPSITTSVFVPTSSSTPLWYDSVSGSAASQLCGPFTVGVAFSTAPASFDYTTMASDFTWAHLQLKQL